MNASGERRYGIQGGQDRHIGLVGLFWMFLRIAGTSFGGFMSMISVVQNVVVERRKFLTDKEVLDGLSLATLLPGPTAINVVAYIGHRLAGAAGAVVCVCAAVLPAFLLMLVFSLAYFRWGHVPSVGKVFMGILPAVTAVTAAAAWRMGRASIATIGEAFLAIGAAASILCFSGFGTTFAVMAVSAIAGYMRFGERRARSLSFKPAHRGSSAIVRLICVNANLLLLAALPAAAAPLPNVQAGILMKLFCAFAAMSMLMFGGGYVFIPLLQNAVVEGYGWITRQEFVDAIALGQVTPGPVMISSAFIGCKVAGITGAAVATIGMFAPPAALMVLCARMFEGVKTSCNTQAAMRGVRAATTGMVIAAAVTIGESAPPHWISIALFALSLIALLRYQVEAVWVVPVAGAAGFVLY